MGTGLTGVLLCAGITVALAVACILIGKGLSLVTDKMFPDNKQNCTCHFFTGS